MLKFSGNEETAWTVNRILMCFTAVLIALNASGDAAPLNTAEEYVTCPVDIIASVTQTPSGWQQVPLTDRLRLKFDSVDMRRMNGKPAVVCNYAGGQPVGVVSSIYKQMPPTYSCSKTSNPRQVLCRSIIKTPKE